MKRGAGGWFAAAPTIQLCQMEGITFLVRVHNEEETLAHSIQSLFALLISYEILLLLNACTDRSVEIARGLAAANPHIPIRILMYNHTLSRPGYETLATDYHSVHSSTTFLNWGLAWAKYKWIAKWDADFIMTPRLLERIHAEGAKGLWKQEGRIVRFGARGLDGGVEMGDYMSSCIDHYRKDVFWETPAFRIGGGLRGVKVRLEWTDTMVEHASRVDRIKSYWSAPGWYVQEGAADTQEAALVRERLLALERDFGMQPMGLGRSGTTDAAAAVAMKIVRAKPAYVELWAGE